LVKYWEEFHASLETDSTLYHPDHKSEDEKRLARNKKARLSRIKRAATANVKGKK
jgi:hypothetical protein